MLIERLNGLGYLLVSMSLLIELLNGLGYLLVSMRLLVELQLKFVPSPQRLWVEL